MESAKLVTAGWLARPWRTTALVWRLVVVALVTGLAIINGIGGFGQLVAAHMGERGTAIETHDAAQRPALRSRPTASPILIGG